MRVQWRHDDHIIYTFIYDVGEISFYNHSWEKVWNYRIGNCIFGLDCFLCPRLKTAVVHVIKLTANITKESTSWSLMRAIEYIYTFIFESEM